MKINSFFKFIFNLLTGILMVFVLTSCDEPEVIDPPVVIPPNPDFVQFGTPFAGVPDPQDAVIYQVNIRAFSSTRNFQGVIARLDSIKNLGVNIIYLMPVYPVGTTKSVNSPYCVKNYKGVNSEFGTLAELRTLVDGAHARGMSVMLDWVANHTAWDNAWMSNKAWYKQDASGNVVSPNGWNDVAQLNFSNMDMRQAMISAMKYWVYQANIDGFRCDYADGPPASFWKQALDSLRNIKTHKLLMLAEGTRSDHYTAGFDFTFGFRYYDELKNIFSKGNSTGNLYPFNTSEYTNATDTKRVVRYITNHDVNSSDGTPLDLFGGLPGSMAAFVTVAYMKSVPMIYSGQEVGYPNRIMFPFTGTFVNWNLNPAMVAEYKKLIAFYNKSTAIRRGTLTTYSNTNLCTFSKTSGTETVFVVSNLRNMNVTYSLPAEIANSQWTNAFTNESVSLANQIVLNPYQYLVLKK
ncbi:MAG TPA: alpha-amylase family glycosyl hydrolase [Paludibacter sp.]|nr:alpha-amylase family glycosyl hydrolase [Paludibacter sp.]